jgi:hypothetical protein
MPLLKEPHYFTHDFPRYKRVENLDTYLELFAPAPEGAVRGEASVWYLYSTDAARRIVSMNPEAKFIVMLRNPVDAAEAFHAHRVVLLGEDISDFEQAWRAQEPRSQGHGVPLYCPDPAHLQYGRIFSYADQLKRVFEAAGRAQVKVVIYEEFFADPTNGLRDVEAFLGVEPVTREAFERINVSRAPRLIFLQRFLSRPPAPLRAPLTALAKLSHRFNLRLGSLGMKLMGVRPVARPLMPAALREELSAFFARDVAEVETLLGRRITAWSAGAGSAASS